ncbi:MAG: hypothetical protein LBN02_09175 [Oscillospiraceae bacterium]|jgi:hypothetical protein|nr:hypothetical protein [Oscillospiraceae bacterium]
MPNKPSNRTAYILIVILALLIAAQIVFLIVGGFRWMTVVGIVLAAAALTVNVIAISRSKRGE